MLNFFRTLIPHTMSREIKELYATALMINFGVALVALFEPIYLYSIGYSVRDIVIFFLIVYVLYLFIMPIGARLASWFGTEKIIVASTVVITLLYISMYGIQWWPSLYYVTAVLYAIQKALYWPAYHADFAQHMVNTETGRQLGSFYVSIGFMYVIGPIIAGSLITVGGYGLLFTVASLIFLSAGIPLLTTKETFKRHQFSYRDSFRTLFARANRRSLLAYLGYSEDLILLVIWPIFIAVVVKNTLEIGFVVGISFLISVVITLVAGKVLDEHNKTSVLRFSTILYSIVWLVRTTVRTTIGVFFIGTLASLVKYVVDLAVMSITYTRAQKTSVMSSIVAFESSLVIGKIAIMIVLVFVLQFVSGTIEPFIASFIVAAIGTLLYALL